MKSKPDDSTHQKNTLTLPRRGNAEATRHSESLYRRLAIALALLAFGHRLLLASHLYLLVTDTGTLALMALNILKGEFPLFLYGFSYSGAPLAYLTALSLRIFGHSLTSLALPTALCGGLWVWFSWLLVKRLAGCRAALATASLFAFPDRLTAWYTHTPDTSYGMFLMFGSLILWLALEIEARDMQWRQLLCWLTPLGGVAGVALWSNALIAPYLLTAAIPLLIYYCRRRFHWRLLLASLPALLLFLLATTPLLLMMRRGTSSETMEWSFKSTWIAQNFYDLITQGIPEFFAWSGALSPSVRTIFWFAITIGLLLATVTLLQQRQSPRWRFMLPFTLIIIFLFAYLPHSMAVHATPRYLLPLWTMFLILGIAIPCGSSLRLPKLVATLLIALWIGWNLVGTVTLMRLEHPSRQARLRQNQRLIAAVEALGARSATMLADYYVQSEANGLTFLSRGKVIFAAAGMERYLPNAQLAEQEQRRIYVCHWHLLNAARASLSALNAQWKEKKISPQFTLLYALESSQPSRRAIAMQSVTMLKSPSLQGAASNLCDNSIHTAVRGMAGHAASFTLDLGQARPLCGMELLPVETAGVILPYKNMLELSLDGRDWETIAPWHERVPIAYASGAMLYLGGGQGRIEYSFAPRNARFVRFTGMAPGDSPLDIPREGGVPTPNEWFVSEARLFEATNVAAQPTVAREADQIAAFLEEMGVRFTICDRWLAARLLARQVGGTPTPTLPLFEQPRHLLGDSDAAPFWRFQPLPDTALIVSQDRSATQATLLRQLFNGKEPWLYSEHGSYASFLFQSDLPRKTPLLLWDGAMLIKP